MIEDNNVYMQPERLLFQLSHKDVQLGYFKYTANALKNIYSGSNLQIIDSIICDELGHKILKFFR